MSEQNLTKGDKRYFENLSGLEQFSIENNNPGKGEFKVELKPVFIVTKC